MMTVRRLTVLAHQSNQGAINIPNNVFNRWAIDFHNGLLLLDIVEDNQCGRTQDKTGSPTIKDLVGLERWLDGFDDGIR